MARKSPYEIELSAETRKPEFPFWSLNSSQSEGPPSPVPDLVVAITTKTRSHPPPRLPDQV